MDKKAKDLSSGNRVKLSLVSALAHSPKLLLLDEPTAGLDPVVRAEVLDTLFEVLESGERAIFYSTHILTDISRLADELVFLNEGQILQRSAKEDLTDQWRKISFRYDKVIPTLDGVINHKQEGKSFNVYSYNGKLTIEALKKIGAENIKENRMTIDEIAVQILRNVEL